MSIDKEMLKRILEKRGEKFLTESVKTEELPEGTIIRREFRSKDGKLVFFEEKKIVLDPMGTKISVITKSSHVCQECGKPIVFEDFVEGRFAFCDYCGKLVCKNCMKHHPENPDIILCRECWEKEVMAKLRADRCRYGQEPI